MYLITLYLSHVCLRLLSFPVCADWPNSDSQDSREPRGVLGAAFKFLRHRCKLSPLSTSRPPTPKRARSQASVNLDVEVKSTVGKKTEVCDLSCIVELSVEFL